MIRKACILLRNKRIVKKTKRRILVCGASFLSFVMLLPFIGMNGLSFAENDLSKTIMGGYEGATVRVTYSDKANIPEDTKLVVNIYSEDSEKYKDFLLKTKASIIADYQNSSHNLLGENDITEKQAEIFLKFLDLDAQLSTFDNDNYNIPIFDVSLIHDGKEIEPEIPVNVEIIFDTPLEESHNHDFAIIHLGESGSEIIKDITKETDENGKIVKVSYEQSSFSPIATVSSLQNSLQTTFAGRGIFNQDWTSAYTVGQYAYWTEQGTNHYTQTNTAVYGPYTPAETSKDRMFWLRYNTSGNFDVFIPRFYNNYITANGGATGTNGWWIDFIMGPTYNSAGNVTSGYRIEDILYVIQIICNNTALNGSSFWPTTVRFSMQKTYEVVDTSGLSIASGNDGDDGEYWGWNRGASSVRNYFAGTIEIIRGAGFAGPLIYVNTDINKSNRFIIHNTVINNNTDAVDPNNCTDMTNKTDLVAVEVVEHGLFMIGQELDLKSGSGYSPSYNSYITNAEVGKGTGVLLTNSNGTSGLPPAEQIYSGQRTNAENYGGSVEFFDSSYIENQYYAVDQQYGKTRLKDSTNPIRSSNIYGVRLARGNSIGKWTINISSFDKIKILLQDPDSWRAGDIIMDSGYYWVETSNIGNQQRFTPVHESDGVGSSAKLNIENYASTGSMFGLEYYDQNAGRPTGWYDTYQPIYVGNAYDAYPYPVIRLTMGVVYNTRTGHWYRNLYDAVNAVNSVSESSGQVTTNSTLQNGDTLVFYGDTIETQTVTINKNITIRASYDQELLANGFADTRSGNASTATWSDSGIDGIVVANGATVTFGGNETTNQVIGNDPANPTGSSGTVLGATGGLTLDADGNYSNVINTNGKTNLKNDITLKDASSYSVYQNGELHIYDNVVFSGNKEIYLVSSGSDPNDIDDAQNHVITLENGFDSNVNGLNGSYLDVTLGNSSSNIYGLRNVVISGVDTNYTIPNSAYLNFFKLKTTAYTNSAGYATAQNGDILDYVFTSVDDQHNTPVLELMYRARAPVTILKVDEDDTTMTLQGAQFTLYDSNNTAIGIYTTNIYGKVNMYLSAGTYRIVESVSPTGYLSTPAEINFTVSIDDINDLWLVSNISVANNQGSVTYTAMSNWSSSNSPLIFTAKNRRTYELPITGGNGVGYLITIGAFFVILSAAISVHLFRQEKKNNGRKCNA